MVKIDHERQAGTGFQQARLAPRKRARGKHADEENRSCARFEQRFGHTVPRDPARRDCARDRAQCNARPVAGRVISGSGSCGDRHARARSGYQAPSPTNVIRAEVIDNQGATGLGEILEQTGMIKGTRNPNSNATNTSSPGQWTADLRGLGGQRTLVLVDSVRASCLSRQRATSPYRPRPIST